MSWARIPLTNLISDGAYHVGLDQITGCDWISTEFYTINAKSFRLARHSRSIPPDDCESVS